MGHDPVPDFAADYRAALQAYLDGGDESAALARAQELGRCVFGGAGSLLALVTVHRRLERQLGASLRTALPLEQASLRAESFLAWALAPFETAHRQALETSRSLLARARRKAAIVASAFDAIVTLDLSGRIMEFNPAAERIFKRRRADVLGQDLADLVLLPSQRASFRQTLAHHRRCGDGASIGGRIEKCALRADGAQFPVEIAVTYIEVDESPFFAVFLRDLSALKAYEAKIEYLANHDALTGLANRNLLKDRLGQAIAHAARLRGTSLGVLFLGVDRLKFITDSLGHAVGDELIRAVAERLQHALRNGDTLARLSSDEFALVLVGLRNPAEELLAMATELSALFMQPYDVGGKSLRMSCSIGACLYPEDGRDVSTLLGNADAAMHRARNIGGGHLEFYTRSLSDVAAERLHLENALWNGLERGEFCLYYQPQVSVREGRIVGAEALIRWQHPELGMVQPARFIALAEETGLIGPIGEWVLETANAQNRKWQHQGLPPLRMAVNVSPHQFRRGGILQVLQALAAGRRLPEGSLELEVTEGSMMEDMEESIRILNELRALGASISIDDFGTGYSSLNYLRRLPVDRLKIDQSFIHEVDADERARTMVAEIIHLSKAFDLSIIAEGVETPGELAFLADHGCDEGQGYLFAQPLPAAEFERLLRGDRRWQPAEMAR